MPRDAVPLLFGLIVVAGTIAGCDHPPPLDPEVPTDARIRRLVADVDDFSQDPRELKVVPRLFAPGCEPDEKRLQRYAEYHYETKQLSQSGDSATLVVSLSGARTGEACGEVKWSAKKINDAWKLTDAPLPE